MLGKLTCALVRMFGGKHDYVRRRVDTQFTLPTLSHVKVCRRCGHTVPIKRRTKS